MVAVRSRHSSIDRVVAALLITVLLSLVVIGQPASASPSQADEPTSTLAPEDAPDIIPRPNSGSAPEDAGDRGGSLQTVLFVVVMGGIVLIGVFVARESCRSRRERGF
jgi:hypothetical protein